MGKEEEGRKFHKLHVLRMNDDFWDRGRGLGNENWKGRDLNAILKFCAEDDLLISEFALQTLESLMSIIPNAILKEPRDSRTVSPRGYWSKPPADEEVIHVSFDVIRSKGCSFEGLNEVHHTVAGKAIGVVNGAMSSGCFKWNVSL